VLAVGDVGFQKKCLGKMSEVAGEGRTVLFVSHNMDAVTRLTGSSLLLDRGKIAYLGPTPDAVHEYQSLFSARTSRSFLPRGRTGRGPSKIESLSLHSLDGSSIASVSYGEPFLVRMAYRTSRSGGVLGGFAIRVFDGTAVLATNVNDVEDIRLTGTGIVECNVDPNYLAPGSYYIQCALFLDAHTYEMDDRIERALDFEVVMNTVEHAGIVDKRVGSIRIPYTWRRLS